MGELRQNPTETFHRVQDGETYVVTNHGRPIADLVPHRNGSWSSGRGLKVFFDQLPDDDTWAAELEESRNANPLEDPWERN